MDYGLLTKLCIAIEITVSNIWKFYKTTHEKNIISVHEEIA